MKIVKDTSSRPFHTIEDVEVGDTFYLACAERMKDSKKWPGQRPLYLLSINSATQEFFMVDLDTYEVIPVDRKLGGGGLQIVKVEATLVYKEANYD